MKTLYCLSFVALLLVVVNFIGCRDLGVVVPPNFSIAELLSSPDTVNIDGKYLTLSTEIWRSFMPTGPPTNSNLVAIIYVGATDTTQLSGSVRCDAVWIVYAGQVWSSYLSPSPNASDHRLTMMARNGPEWEGPVDVVVRILDPPHQAHLLRASEQRIGKVY